jgi:hypothetical protein
MAEPAVTDYGGNVLGRVSPVTAAESQLATFFTQYEPAIADLGRGVRAKLRARLPGLSEIVYYYERQGALVISYSPSEHGYEGVCSLALYPGRVCLHFAKGAALADADPARLLQGRGKGVRHVVLSAVTDLDCGEIETLMVAALDLAGVRVRDGAEGAVIVKAEGQARRAGSGARGRTPPAAR